MAYGEAEDAGGPAPAKDNNESVRHFIRRTLTIFECVDYRQSSGSDAVYHFICRTLPIFNRAGYK